VKLRPAGPGKPQRSAYLFLSPWLLGASLLTVGPMVASLWLSFTDYDLFDSPKWVGLRNYRTMFTADDHFWNAVWTTVRFVAIAVPIQLALALGVALLLAGGTRRRSKPRRGLGFYRSAFYAPSLLGASVSVALVWRAMFGGGGAFITVLGWFGIHTGSWIDQPQYALYSLVALAVWQFGAPMVIFLAGLKQIPVDLYEAAELDGAGPVRRFATVTVPMLSPVILFNLVLDMIHAFQSFTGAFVISNGRGGPSDSTLLYTLYLYQRGFVDFQMGYASAMAMLLLAVSFGVTSIILINSRKWVHYGGAAR
jgi:multiple sugar transport system permease protein